MNKSDAWITIHCRRTALQFCWPPDVILVTVRDCVPGAATQRIHKIVCESTPHVITEYTHRERGCAGELLDHIERTIGGLIITDHQFTWQQRLPRQTIELLPQPSFAVIRRQRD